jgi:hypothetical protein
MVTCSETEVSANARATQATSPAKNPAGAAKAYNHAKSKRPGSAARGGINELELVHVMLLFRHGDRSPITTKVGKHLVMDDAEKDFWAAMLPNEEKINKLGRVAKVVGMEKHLPPPVAPRDAGVFPNGQLTLRGIEEMEEKGYRMRKYYAEFLSNLTLENIYIRSTNVRRTIRSCQSLLHGLLPEFIPESPEREPQLHIHTTDVVSLEPSFTQADYKMLMARYKDTTTRKQLPSLPESVGCTTTLEEHVRKAIGIADDDSVCYTSRMLIIFFSIFMMSPTISYWDVFF